MAWYSVLTDLFSGNIGKILKEGANIVDEYFETDQEKTQAKLMLQKLADKSKEQERAFKMQVQNIVLERDKIQADLHKTKLDAASAVITAELQHGDKFTKRARPTVVYFGLVLIFAEMFGLRLLLLNQFAPDAIIASNEIVKSFLLGWSGIVGMYGVGRSMEIVKKAKENRKIKTEQPFARG